MLIRIWKNQRFSLALCLHTSLLYVCLIFLNPEAIHFYRYLFMLIVAFIVGQLISSNIYHNANSEDVEITNLPLAKFKSKIRSSKLHNPNMSHKIFRIRLNSLHRKYRSVH